MPNCPFCTTDLSEVESQSGSCPHCGRALLSDAANQQQPGPEDTAKDAAQATPPPGESDTADDGQIADTLGPGETDEKPLAETIDPGSMPAPPPSEDDLGTADEQKIAETLKAGDAAEAPPAEDDLKGPGGAAALDADGLPPDVAEKMSAMWSGSYRPDTPTTASLKAEVSAVVAESNLIIQPRVIRQTGEQEAAAADYELMGRLGEGGIGIVHAARQASINRTVAVKQLKSDFAADRDKREEFLSEAVVTGDLEHPNIVPIYDLVRSQQGELFYSMKRVKGTPWNTVVAQKSFQENLECLMKIADAVAFAHARGVVHRDLKPENVMLGDFGEVLLMDWGLAVSQAKRDGSGMGGTPAYMAPEMATGPVEKIGFHSDVYLLGAILFEVITGKPPHTGKNVMQCLLAAAKNKIRPTEKSGELLDISTKAMATDPEDRHVSVGAFQTAIREYQSHSESVSLSTRAEEDLAAAEQSEDYQTYARALFGFQEALGLWDGNTRAGAGVAEAIMAYASSALRKADYDLAASLLDPANPQHTELYQQIKAKERERDARQQRLKTAKRIGVGLVATILIIFTGAFFLVRAEANRAKIAEGVAVEQRDEADRQSKEADTQRQKAEEQTEIAIQKTTEAQEQRDEADTQRRKAEEQTEIANQKTTEAQEQRDEADRQKQLAVDAQRKEEYEAYIARIGLAAAKIDENSFQMATQLLNDCPGRLRNWEWGRLMHLCSGATESYDAKEPLDCVAYSPDGKRFVTGGWDGFVRVWDVESGDELLAIATWGKLLPDVEQYVYAAAFSPDGTSIATGDNDNTGYVKIWDARTGQLKRKLSGHADSVLSVEFSRDGRLLTSSYDGTARLWDLQTGQVLQTFRGHDWWVWSAAFSPDEKRIVTASQDGSAMVWSVETGKPKPPFTGHTGPVYAAAFSPDGKVATAGYDKRVLIWDPDKVIAFDYGTLTSDKQSPPTEFRALEGHTAAVRSVEFSANGKLVLTGGNDNTVRVWDVASGKLLKTLRGHAGRVYCCTFSPKASAVLSGSHDHRAKIWDIEGYEEVRVFRGHVLEGHGDAILGAAFRPDGQQIVSASRDRTAKTWDFGTGEELREFKEGHDYLASTAIFFPDGKRLITAAVDNTTRVWDVANGTQLLSLEGTGPSAAVVLAHNAKWILTGSDDRAAKLWSADDGRLIRKLEAHDAEVTAVAISPHDRFVLTGDARGDCRLWDAQSGAEIWHADAHSRGITAAFFLADGSRVLTASTDNTVAQWDVKTGREDRNLILKHPDAVTAMALSPGGRQALTTCADKTLRLWDVDTAKEIARLYSGDVTVNSVAFSADGRRAVTTGADNTVRVWDMQTRREILADNGPFLDLKAASGLAWSAVFSPDGGYLLTVGGNDARLWDAGDGRENMSFSPQGSVASANYSPDGKQIVTGSWDNAARIWDAQTGVALWKLEGEHDQYVNSAVFSPDGKMVLTASDDKTVKLWDARSGKWQLTFAGHERRVRSAVFSSDGKRVLTASNDKTARIWDARTGEELLVLRGHAQALLYAAFSPDDSQVITASEDNTAKLWNATTGEKTKVSLEGHTASVASVAFSPDGRRAITGSLDNTVKIWDARTSKEILTLKGHSQEVTTVAFSPDGRSVLTGSRDGTLIVWLAAEWQGGDAQDPAEIDPVTPPPLASRRP